MQMGAYVTEFVEACAAIKTYLDLHDLLGHATRILGFDQFALNHHVDLAGPPEDAVTLMNYSPEWIDIALSRRYHIDDPVHAASAKASVGFSWGELNRYLFLTERQRTILTEARRFGLCDGFTVPVHIPGEYRGTCSFGARRIELTTDIVGGAQLIGCFAFEAARRLVRRGGDLSPQPVPQLTQRQLDCLLFVANGKSDWAIGKILGLSPATVHQHVGDAMRRYSVATRTQLVVRALFDSQICYNAALRP